MLIVLALYLMGGAGLVLGVWLVLMIIGSIIGAVFGAVFGVFDCLGRAKAARPRDDYEGPWWGSPQLETLLQRDFGKEWRARQRQKRGGSTPTRP